MDTLYIDCRMGVTGNKLLGALMDIMENPDLFVYNFNRIGMEGISMQRLPEALNGVTGSQIEFRRRASDEFDPYADEIDADEADGEEHKRPHHRSRRIYEIEEIIKDLRIAPEIKERTIKVYDRIAQAAAKTNNRDRETMKMRRTGSRDVIASIVGVCMAIDELKPGKVIASTVAVGDGYVHTPRGRMPIPTPEVQMLLEGVPFTAGTEHGELCTLDGAALIAEIADEFGNTPEMTISKSGAGFGRRTFKSGINCVRTYLGKSLYTAANEAYIALTAEVYGIEKDALPVLGKELEEIGIVSAHTVSISDMMGNSGYKISITVKNDTADAVATHIMEKTGAKRVIRSLVNAYTA